MPITDIPDEEVTIAEFIKANLPDYATGHFGKWRLKGGGPSRHGYDEGDGATGNREGFQGPPNPKRIYGVNDRSLAFIDKQAAAGKPFLLQMSHYAVHTPIQARGETIEVYKARKGGAHSNAGYGAMTENLDESLAAVMAKLEEHGIADNTYVVYTSDNGGENTGNATNNTPLKLGKTHTWEGGIRVPLIVRGPGIAAGASSDVVVNGYDLFATISELLGIAALLPADQDGGSLAPVLLAGADVVERASGDFIWYYPHYRNMKGVFRQAAIRSGDYKLVKFYEKGDLHLYDLSKDLSEANDLAESMADKADDLHMKLNAYLAAVGAKIPTQNPDYDPKNDLGITGGPMNFGRPPPRGPR